MLESKRLDVKHVRLAGVRFIFGLFEDEMRELGKDGRGEIQGGAKVYFSVNGPHTCGSIADGVSFGFVLPDGTELAGGVLDFRQLEEIVMENRRQRGLR